MTDVRAALREAARRLEGVSDSPRLDAELLMAHALGIERPDLLLDPSRYGVPAGFAALIERRAAHEPVAYIVGYRDFWTIRVAVGPGVLIPRPDSETLIEAALAHVDDREAPLHILDLGTGPGTLMLALLSELPEAAGLGVDVSAEALAFARSSPAREPYIPLAFGTFSIASAALEPASRTLSAALLRLSATMSLLALLAMSSSRSA